MFKKDLIPHRIRRIEKEIDDFYLSNNLIKTNVDTALYYLLLAFEDFIFIPLINSGTSNYNFSHNEIKVIIDRGIMDLQFPIRWILRSCSKEKVLNFTFNKELYKSATDLLHLGAKYNVFDSAFTLASIGIIKLKLEGNTLKPSGKVYIDHAFQAYDLKTNFRKEMDYQHLKIIINELLEIVIVEKDNFSYKLSDSQLKKYANLMKDSLVNFYELPDTWKFKYFSIIDFQKITNVILTITIIHFLARLIAVKQGC